MSQVGAIQVIEQNEVHGDGGGHEMMMIKLNMEKKKEKNKNQEDQGNGTRQVFVLHSRQHKGCE